MRRTKIVCTLGPACEDEDLLRQMMRNGMNVARFNFSHGDFEEHGNRVEKIRRLSKEENVNVALLLDTKGPEIRTGKFEGGKVHLEQGSEVIIRHDDILGNAHEFSCTYKTLHEDVKPGDVIMVDDGLIELDVTKIEDKDVYTEVRNGGPVSTYKGMNLPGIETNLPALTDKDRADLEFGVENNYDFVAASFIRKASDVEEIRRFFAERGDTDIKIISKIENQEGVDNFEEILAASDGIMVARGDLGVEVPPEKVPAYQKYMLRRCKEEGKFSITATQMLDSMEAHPRPTRAEVSDVANAVYDGTGAVMLSGESANGDYPAESVAMLDRITRETEKNLDYRANFELSRTYLPTVQTAVAEAAVEAGMELEADAYVMVSDNINEIAQVMKYHPYAPIVVGTTRDKVLRQAGLLWDVYPVLIEESDPEAMYDAVKKYAEEKELIADGSAVVELRYTPENEHLDAFRVSQYSKREALKGEGHGRHDAVGTVVNLKELDSDCFDLDELMTYEDLVLVADEFTEEDLPLVRYAIALVQESAEMNPVLDRAIDKNKPVVTDVKNATADLNTGDFVTVSSEGTIK